MVPLRRQFLRAAAGAGLACLAPRIALAQAYPSRPVRLLVPYVPGGPSDIVARLAAQKLAEELGQPFVVENVGGAGGNIGLARGAKAAPDGYTVLIVPPNIVVNPALYASVPYDPYRDFEPVTIAVTSTLVLTVNPALPVRSVSELAALVKSSPGKYAFASPGNGTPPHLVGEQFRLALGLDMPHVPFAGAAQAVTSTVGGHTVIAFTSSPPAAPQIRDGKLRALAVTSKTRSAILPDVPTMTEAGYPDIAGEGWFAFIVPAGTPKAITALLHRQIVKAMNATDVRERMAALGFEPVGISPEESSAQFRQEGAKWAKVIREAGIKAD